MDSSNDVNPHYLDHVIATGEKRDVEVSEDIFTSNGLKLLAKGARVNDGTRERLLNYKLQKPLEECLQIAQAVTSKGLVETAEALLDQHQILRALFSSRENPIKMLNTLSLASHSRSLLTVFADHSDKKLEHAVIASLVGMGLSRKIEPGNEDMQRVLCVSGLFHDVGELYIDPAYLKKGMQLTQDEWKHVAAHPVVANRLLRDMPQIGKAVSNAVLNHHERLDGFGYPRGLNADQIPLDSQVLAVAEIMVGLLESSSTPTQHAAVAIKLVPGEFHRKIIDVIAGLTQHCERSEFEAAALPPLEKTRASLERILNFLSRIEAMLPAVTGEMSKASQSYKVLLESSMHRFESIRRALSSTGLDPAGYHSVMGGLEADPAMRLEVVLIVREIRWRLRELERELKLRIERQAPNERKTLQHMVEQLEIQRDAFRTAQAQAESALAS